MSRRWRFGLLLVAAALLVVLITWLAYQRVRSRTQGQVPTLDSAAELVARLEERGLQLHVVDAGPGAVYLCRAPRLREDLERLQVGGPGWRGVVKVWQEPK